MSDGYSFLKSVSKLHGQDKLQLLKICIKVFLTEEKILFIAFSIENVK